MDTTAKDKEKATAHFFEPERRRPRFKRVQGQRGGTSRAGVFELMPRDIAIIELVAKHRFLNTEQIVRALRTDAVRTTFEMAGNTTGRRVPERLTELFQHEYLARPIGQRDLRIRNGVLTAGTMPMVYALDSKGAKLLEEFGRLPNGAAKRARDNDNAARVFIGHTLWLADLRIALDEAAPRHGVTLQHDSELLRTIPRDFKKHPGAPWSMRPKVVIDEVTTDDNGRKQTKRTTQDIGVNCDACFSILRDKNGKQLRRNAMVEIDMGTMPVARWKRNGNLWMQGTSIMKKVLAYEAAFNARLEHELFDWKGYDVLIITTTEARVQTMAKEIAKLNGGKGCGLFLLASKEAIESRKATKGEIASDILDYPFVDCFLQPHRLLE